MPKFIVVQLPNSFFGSAILQLCIINYSLTVVITPKLAHNSHSIIPFFHQLINLEILYIILNFQHKIKTIIQLKNADLQLSVLLNNGVAVCIKTTV